MRAYLNGDFYNSFSASDRARISLTNNSNPDNPWYGTNGGNNTLDNIFLLSLDEVCRYFGDSTDKLNNRGNQSYYISDANNENRLTKYGNNGNVWWWLRSPGDYSYGAASVDGDVGVCGRIVNDHSHNGVRPALWITLE
jgi:hypothetical protein